MSGTKPYFPAIHTEVAFGSNPLDTFQQWTAISDYVISMSVKSPFRNRELDRFQAGELDLVLDNSVDASARFNPRNVYSPYYPNVVPMRRIRVTAGYVAEVFRNDPLSYYRLGEASGTQAVDEQARHHGTYFNTPTLGVTGRIPRCTAVTFTSAQSEYVALGDVSAWELGAASYVAWIKTTTAAGVVICEQRAGTNQGLVQIDITGTGKARLLWREDGNPSFSAITGTTTVTDGNWHLIVASRQVGTAKLYVDAVQEGGNGVVVGTFTQDEAFIGSNDGGSYFNGTIDEVSIHAAALPQASIDALYLAGTNGYGGEYLFSGFVEDWEQHSDYPFVGQVTVKCTDGMLGLNAALLDGSPYEIEVRADAPLAWWRLNDDGDQMIDTIGGYHGLYHGEPDQGRDSLVAGSDDSSTNFPNDNKSCGRYLSTSGAPITAYPFTIEAVIKLDPSLSGQRWIFWLTDLGQFFYGIMFFVTGSGGSTPGGRTAFFISSSGIAQACYSTKPVNDGQVHHVVLKAANSGSIQLYVDGVEGTNLVTAGNPLFPTAPLEYVVGNRRPLVGATGGLGGEIAEVAVYNTALSDARIAAHASAALTAWKGDLSGARVTRILDAIGWPSSLRDIDTGQAALQSQELGSAGEALQAVADAEVGAGAVYFKPNMAVKFRERYALQKAPYTTSQATFSDQAAGVNYDAVRPDFAVDLIKNVARVSRAGGPVQRAENASSKTKYFQRKYEKTGLILLSDNEALGHAQFVVAKKGEPPFRYGQLDVTPYGVESTMFPLLISLGIGERLTVVQRAPGEPASHSDDQYIEGKVLDIGPGETMSGRFQLSPVDDTAYFTLGTSTLNGAHVLGY